MTVEALVQQTDLHPVDRDGVVGNELVPVSVEPLSVHASLVQVSPLPSRGPDAEPRFYEMILIAILTGLCEPALDAITYPLCSQSNPPTALLCTSKSLWFAMRIGVRTLFLADMPRHFLPQFGQLVNVTFAAFRPIRTLLRARRTSCSPTLISLGASTISTGSDVHGTDRARGRGLAVKP